MSIELITIAMIGSLLLLLVIGMPMAFALGFVAVGFAYAFFGWGALQLISSRIYGFVSVYVLIAVPMFLLMATIMDRSGVARDLYDAIMEGAVERVRPKMMTVTAIMGGLLPILWGSGAGASVMRRIAAPMIGGMVSSTVLTLLVIPAIYGLWKERELRRPVM